MLSSLKPVEVIISNASRMSSCKRARVQHATGVRWKKIKPSFISSGKFKGPEGYSLQLTALQD